MPGRSATVNGAMSPVSSPSGFEAYAAVRHPAWRCDCTEENLPDLRSGHERGRPVRWAEVAESDVPVVYGYILHTKRRITRTGKTQYRRLQDGGWVVDELPGAELRQVLRPGDAWITGPREGSLEPDLARTLQSVLAGATEDSALCWFGIWEGFGYLTGAQRAAPLDRSARPALAPVPRAPRPPRTVFRWTIGFEHQTAKPGLGPGDRSWCVATEIDAEVTYVGGSKELISAILEAPDLEAVPARPDERLAGLRDVLTPIVIVDQPAVDALPPGFESREYPPDRHPLGWRHRLGIVMGRIHRLVLWLNPSMRKEHEEMTRRGLLVSRTGCRWRDKFD